MKERRLKYHIFRKNDDLKMQDRFLFLDTETKIVSKTEDEEIQRLRLGWVTSWDRRFDVREDCYFDDARRLWDFVEDFTYRGDGELEKADPRLSLDYGHSIVFAHNMEFDFRIGRGIEEMMMRRKWGLRSLYVKGNVFMLSLEKEGRIIDFWDTFNYVPVSLAKLGEAVGVPKLECEPFKDSIDKVSAYCRNDVRILEEFIKQLIGFLEAGELTRLRPTISSLALNAFRHRFYDPRKQPIYVHARLPAIRLERASYRGGITDCFYCGEVLEDLVKCDFNSMYPSVMFDEALPVRLVHCTPNLDGRNLEKINDAIGRGYDVIANVEVYLPEKYAYILNRVTVKGEEKCLFLSGRFRGTFTTPELEFIMKHGSIREAYETAIYEKANIFRGYVDYFWKKRMEYGEDKPMWSLMCKSFLNNLYGKFGASQSEMRILGAGDDTTLSDEELRSGFAKHHVKDGTGKNIREYTDMALGHQVVRMEKSDENSFDSFVAVSSLITSYARMRLVGAILKAGRDNVYYCDTDSIILKSSALGRLGSLLDAPGAKTLGKLKIEGHADNSFFVRPKFYRFGSDLHIKGVKSDHEVVEETGDFLAVRQTGWERMKTAASHGNIGQYALRPQVKVLDLGYDKGVISKSGRIRPYTMAEILLANDARRLYGPERMRGTVRSRLFDGLAADLWDKSLGEDEVKRLMAESVRI